MSKENLEIVRRLMEAWERRDMEAVFALYDPAIVWDNSTLPAPNAGVYHGHEGVRQFFREWLEAFETQSFTAAGAARRAGWSSARWGRREHASFTFVATR
jgi:ketosteroid isomerase-like protein